MPLHSPSLSGGKSVRIWVLCKNVSGIFNIRSPHCKVLIVYQCVIIILYTNHWSNIRVPLLKFRHYHILENIVETTHLSPQGWDNEQLETRDPGFVALSLV